MCGRYTRRAAAKVIYEHFGIDPDMEFSEVRLAPSYNIAPTTFQPVVRLNRDTGEREIVPMRWGLIPPWCKDLKLLGLSTINAKAETLVEKSMWKHAFRQRRCLVPADGFYEWKKIDAKTKQPYAFGMKDNAVFAFAGVWERWIAPDKKPVDSFAIITTIPNELAATVHTRMPLIVEPKDYTRWLTPSDADERPPLDLLRPYGADAMKAWKVDPRVGNARNNEPWLCDEWDGPPNSA